MTAAMFDSPSHNIDDVDVNPKKSERPFYNFSNGQQGWFSLT